MKSQNNRSSDLRSLPYLTRPKKLVTKLFLPPFSRLDVHSYAPRLKINASRLNLTGSCFALTKLLTVMAVAEDSHPDFPIDIIACPITYGTVFILLPRILYHKTADNAIAKSAVFEKIIMRLF